MWFFLWILFVLTVIVAFAWSYHVLYEQKRAWKAFAQKYNLDFFIGTFFEAPSATGMIKGRKVNLYTQKKINDVTRTPTTETIVEVFLNQLPDTVAVVTSPGLVDFVQSLDLPAAFIVEHTAWPSNMIARTFADEIPDQWFLQNPNRIKAIKMLSDLPFDIGFVCDADNAFVAVRTSHPLTDIKRINQVFGKLFQAAEMLESSSLENERSTDVKEELLS